VAKCFHEAREYIPVDDEKIAQTLNWLINIQEGDGSFIEQGRVMYRPMQVLVVLIHTIQYNTIQ